MHDASPLNDHAISPAPHRLWLYRPSAFLLRRRSKVRHAVGHPLCWHRPSSAVPATATGLPAAVPANVAQRTGMATASSARPVAASTLPNPKAPAAPARLSALHPSYDWPLALTASACLTCALLTTAALALAATTTSIVFGGCDGQRAAPRE